MSRLTDELKKFKTGHEDEKEEWKGKAVELLGKLQCEEDRARAASKEAEQLAKDVIKLGDENMKLDQQLSAQEDKIRIMLGELDERTAELKRVQAENEQLTANYNESENKNAESTKELKKSSEQLRMMAEKVFHLIGQLRKMDEWKSQATEDLRSAAKKIAVLEKRGEALQKMMDRDDKVGAYICPAHLSHISYVCVSVCVMKGSQKNGAQSQR